MIMLLYMIIHFMERYNYLRKIFKNMNVNGL